MGRIAGSSVGDSPVRRAKSCGVRRLVDWMSQAQGAARGRSQKASSRARRGASIGMGDASQRTLVSGTR